MFLFYIKISDHGKKKKKEIFVRQNVGYFFYSAQNDPVNKLTVSARKEISIEQNLNIVGNVSKDVLFRPILTLFPRPK